MERDLLSDGELIWDESPTNEERMPQKDPVSTADVGSYIASMLRGMRLLTGANSREDLRQLDHLLATAEGEASNLASRALN